MTPGDPLFCNFCGRSYDSKLCPRLHLNPRSAEACSECGSRDLSTPQPRPVFGGEIASFVLRKLSGVLLLLMTVLLFVGFFQVVLSSPELLGKFLVLALLMGLLWYLYMRLPRFVRRGIGRMVSRRGDGNRSLGRR